MIEAPGGPLAAGLLEIDDGEALGAHGHIKAAVAIDIADSDVLDVISMYAHALLRPSRILVPGDDILVGLLGAQAGDHVEVTVAVDVGKCIAIAGEASGMNR